MTPHEIAGDSSLRARYLDEVAYLDRARPLGTEAQRDADLLAGPDGVSIVSWLWPREMYVGGSGVEPSSSHWLWKWAAARSQPLESGSTLDSAAREMDRRRAVARQPIARRFVAILNAIARATGRSVEDIRAHVMWSLPATERELDEWMEGRGSFPFSVIVGLCHALQLEFTDAWVLVDPARLARRVDQSVLAQGISHHLHNLTTDSLQSVLRKLPQGSAPGTSAAELASYRAPEPDGRYSALYEILARDERAVTTYSLEAIDRILENAGEARLQKTARSERSWWTGTAQPQASAWWGAGYRVRDVTVDPRSGEVDDVVFEAMPGRQDWLADPDRTTGREYRVPEPLRRWVYPEEAAVVAIGEALVSAFAGWREVLSDLEKPRSNTAASTPDDPDVRRLVEFLSSVGEASRAQILEQFNAGEDGSAGDAWVTNLLARAKRQGWIDNRGTRSRPRWTVREPSVKCPACGFHSLSPLSNGQSVCSMCGATATIG